MDEPGHRASTKLGVAAGLLLLLAAGLAVRMLYLREHERRPDYRAPLSDAAYHDVWARALATGDLAPPPGWPDQQWDRRPYFKPPGYPVVLSWIYRVGGDTPRSPRVAQIGLGLLNVVLIFFLARGWFGAAVGWWSSALAACSWILVYYEQELVEPVFLVALMLAFLLASGATLRRPTYFRVAVAGVLLGVCALFRSNLVLFFPVAAAWFGWEFRRAGRSSVLGAVVLLVAAVLATIPALVRNVRVSDERVWISANGGINLYFGNNPDANGMDSASPDIPAWSPFDYPAIVRQLEAQTGAELGYSGASRVYARRALAFWRQHPGAALRLTFRKALQFWSANEIGNEAQVASLRRDSRVLSRLPLPFSLTAALAFTGLALFLAGAADPAPRPGARSLVVLSALLVAVYFASFVPFFNAARFRAPLVPILYVWCGLAVTGLRRVYAAEGLDGAKPWLAMLLMGWGLLAVNRVPDRDRGDRTDIDRGIALMRLGQMDQALAAFERAVQQRPADFYARYNLGNALLQARRPAEALAEFSKALEGQVDHVPSLLGRGKALGQLQRFDQAAEQFRAVTRADPGRPEAWLLLASTEQAMNDLAEAESHYRQALRLMPSMPEAMIGLGHVMLSQGRAADAAVLFRRALELRPDDPDARSGLRATAL